MKTMTRRERILTALNHQEPDRVPVDFGGTAATSIFAEAYRGLKRHLGLGENKPIRRYYPTTEVVEVDDEVVRRFDGAAYPIIAGGANVQHYADQPSPLGEDGFIDEYGVAFGRPVAVRTRSSRKRPLRERRTSPRLPAILGPAPMIPVVLPA